MQTKGIASARSPVCNLRQHKPDISRRCLARRRARVPGPLQHSGDGRGGIVSIHGITDARSQINWVDEGDGCEGIEETTKGMHDLYHGGHSLGRNDLDGWLS
jgi:hypothetical protein